MRFRQILGDPGADGVGEGKTKWAGKDGAKKSKERGEALFPFLLPLGLRG